MKLKHLLALFLVLACGTADPSLNSADAGADAGIGEARQAMTGARSQINGITYGRKPSGAPCDYLPGANDVCYVASKKVITYTTSDQYSTGLDFQTWELAFQLATFMLNTPGGQGAGGGFIFEKVEPRLAMLHLVGSNPHSGSGANVDDYITTEPFLGDCYIELSESIPGKWRAQTCMQAYVDGPKFLANNCGGACRQSLSMHIAGSILLRMAGIGYQTADTTRLSSRATTATDKFNSVTALQKCFLQNFSASNPTTWAHSGTCS